MITTQRTPLTEKEEFEVAARPLVDYLRVNHHPHVTAIVTSNGIELLEGLMAWSYRPTEE